MSSQGNTESGGGRGGFHRVWPPLAVLVVLLGYFLYARQANGPADDQAPGVPAREGGEGIRMAYVEWASELASIHVVQAVLEDYMGVQCDILPVSAAAMWQAVASGDCDAMVAAWLPDTHRNYYEKVRDDVVNLGSNLEGTRIGLVVPSYVTIDRIPQLPPNAGRFGNRIVGIDPGAGIMTTTETAMRRYDLDDFRLVSSSSAAMAATLGEAVDRDEWIVVTGWTPHWMFQRWDLKFLEDPQMVYGEPGRIHTIVREGLRADRPDVYTFLDQFHWTPEDMEQVMAWNQQPDSDPAETARRWIKENPDMVKEWLQGTSAEDTAPYANSATKDSG